MQRRWIEVLPGAMEKREKKFDAWVSGQEISFESEAAKIAYQERASLIKDAALMRKPNRIPVCPAAGHFPLAYAGISWYDAMYNYEKLAFAWGKIPD